MFQNIKINNCIFNNNYAVFAQDEFIDIGYGGAINLWTGVHLKINNSLFINNSAGSLGNSMFGIASFGGSGSFIGKIKEDKIIKKVNFTHPYLNTKSFEMQSHLKYLQGKNISNQRFDSKII